MIPIYVSNLHIHIHTQADKVHEYKDSASVSSNTSATNVSEVDHEEVRRLIV